jgi:hypothetical protein
MRTLHTSSTRSHTLTISLTVRELGNDLWRQNPVNKNYDYKLIHSRLQSLMEAQEAEDVQGLMYVIRSGTQSSGERRLITRSSAEPRKHHLKESLQPKLCWVYTRHSITLFDLEQNS